MQLRKQNWKRARNTEKFTTPTTEGYRARHGGFKSHGQHAQQLHSRETNPQDPINN